MARRQAAVVREFAGINLEKPARHIADNELAMAKNTYQPDPGILGRRPDTTYASLEATPRNASLYYSADVLMSLLAPSGKQYIFAWVSTVGTSDLLVLAGSTVPTGAAEGSVGAFDTVGARPDWFMWRNALYICHGNPANRRMTRVIEDSAYSTGIIAAEHGSEWDRERFPRVGTVYRDRFVLAGFDSPDESRLAFCELDDPNTLLTEGKEVEIGPGDGDRIVGVSAAPVIGGTDYASSYLIVFKNNSTWFVSGEPPTVTDDGTLDIHPLTLEAGLASKETIAWTQHGLLWASADNVWFKPTTGLPVPIGDAIRPVLQKAPAGGRRYWSAAYYKNHYRLALVSSEADRTDQNEPQRCDVQYWCDLRNPSQPKWFGPMTIPCSAMLSVNPPNDAEVLYLATRGAALGGTHSFLAWADQNNALHVDAHLAGEETPGEQEIRFKEFDFGDPMVDKILQAVELHIAVDKVRNIEGEQNPSLSTSEFRPGVFIHGNNSTKVRTAVPPELVEPGDVSTEQNTGFVLDFSNLDEDILGGGLRFKSVAAYPPDSERFLAKTVQLVVKASPIIETAVPGGAYVASWIPDMRIAGFGLRWRMSNRRPA